MIVRDRSVPDPQSALVDAALSWLAFAVSTATTATVVVWSLLTDRSIVAVLVTVVGWVLTGAVRRAAWEATSEWLDARRAYRQAVVDTAKLRHPSTLSRLHIQPEPPLRLVDGGQLAEAWLAGLDVPTTKMQGVAR